LKPDAPLPRQAFLTSQAFLSQAFLSQACLIKGHQAGFRSRGCNVLSDRVSRFARQDTMRHG